MKDFFDLYVLAQEFTFSMTQLASAVNDTFTRRATTGPVTLPDGLTHEFAKDPAKLQQWHAFIMQNVAPPRNTYSLANVVTKLAEFLLPVFAEVCSNSGQSATWRPGGPWINN